MSARKVRSTGEIVWPGRLRRKARGAAVPPPGFTVTQGRRRRTASKGAVANSARAHGQVAGTRPDGGKVRPDVTCENGSWCRRPRIGVENATMSASGPVGDDPSVNVDDVLPAWGRHALGATQHSESQRTVASRGLLLGHVCYGLSVAAAVWHLSEIHETAARWSRAACGRWRRLAMPSRHLQRVVSHGDNLRPAVPGRQRRRSPACPA